MPITHYETLGVPRDASKADITSAFRAQMRALHSDAGGDDEMAKRASSAYNVLSNPTKRAAYDRTLEAEPPATPAPSRPPGPTPKRPHDSPRRRVFHPEHAAFSMLTVDPSAWSWYTAPDDGPAPTPRGRTLLPHALRVLAFLSWALAGAAAAATLGLPLGRLGLVSVPVALLCGLAVHLAWSLLLILRTLTHRIGLVAAMLLAAGAAITIYLDAGTPLPTLGALLCLGFSLLTTYLSFGLSMADRGDRERNGIIDSSFITQVGSTSLGARPDDVDRLVGALDGAFGHRTGVRVILLPDRVTPRAGVSPVRSQVAVVVGKAIHLIAIPPIGGNGLEIAGSDVISDGQVHRNVVRDEVQALSARLGRGGHVRGYIVPTRLDLDPAAETESHGATFASLTRVIATIGDDAGTDLDQPHALFRHRALESMALLI